ncbi:hypothetical protein KKH15_01080 [Patescibacteria group bacterium]|nr:hypothetical protein [Patescibacteria group bacterium]MBU1755002.1 hypothetical protein [Patescibacteria group bacterium]
MREQEVYAFEPASKWYWSILHVVYARTYRASAAVYIAYVAYVEPVVVSIQGFIK